MPGNSIINETTRKPGLLEVSLTQLESNSQGTFGLLQISINGFIETFYTGELPWQDNQSNVSCVPKGTYLCKWTKSPAFKRFTYELQNVPKRSGIRIHSANFMGDATKGYKKQLNGCIAIGERLGFMDGQRALLLSSPAIRRFETLLNKQDFQLEIK